MDADMDACLDTGTDIDIDSNLNVLRKDTDRNRFRDTVFRTYQVVQRPASHEGMAETGAA